MGMVEKRALKEREEKKQAGGGGKSPQWDLRSCYLSCFFLKRRSRQYVAKGG